VAIVSGTEIGGVMNENVKAALAEFKSGDVKAPRIGSGTGYFVLGWVSLLLGIVVMAGAGTDVSMTAFGGFLIALAAGSFSVGFWKSIAHKIELRLIDVQTELVRTRSEAAVRADKLARDSGGVA
jgi:hypothetical protein